MAIYAFNDPNDKSKVFVGKSLTEQCVSRFGWSWFETANLHHLKKCSWEEMSDEEILVWNKTNFLFGIKKGDWIVHINVPYWGSCILAQVESEYYFDPNETEIHDFRHCLKINPDTIIQFERNDEEIHPIISRKLKLRGRYWRIYNEKEFFESIENLKNGTKINKAGESKGIHYLKKEINPFLVEITKRIQRTHPEKNLEYLICDLMKNVPNVTEAYVNGSGWGTDYGADVIVKYNSGLGLLNLQKQETLVIQVKSYEGIHYDIHSVNQIETAIEKFGADSGLLITTANKSDELEKAIEELSNKTNKPIALMAGEDVAKFILKFENGMLLDF